MDEGIIKTKVVVLGAGVSGLAAADYLSRRGEKPVVIEKEETVGGMCRSFKRDGYIFDLGGHRFLPQNEEMADYIMGLFSDKQICQTKRKSSIYLRGKYLHYPPEFADILVNLGLFTCIKAGVDSSFSRLKHFIHKKPERSLKDWLIHRFGYTLYNIYFGPYSDKLWGRESTQISADWAPQRISVPNLRAALKSLITGKEKRIKSYAREFLYPSGGIGKLPERMSERIIDNGGRVFTGYNIIKISKKQEGFAVEAATSSGEKKTFLSDQIISTIPVTETLDIFDPQPPEHLTKDLKFRSVRFLNVMIDAPRITDNTWIYIPEGKYIFFRVQELSNWHNDNCPPGKTSLTLEVACEKDDMIWNMKDEDLCESCINDIQKIGIDIKDKILGYFSTFAEYAYPVYSLTYKDDLQKIYDFTNTVDGFILCGRQGLFRYLNMDQAIENGIEAAEHIVHKKQKSDYLNSSEKKEYLEANLYLKKNE